MKNQFYCCLIFSALFFSSCGEKPDQVVSQTDSSKSDKQLFVRKNAHCEAAQADLKAYEDAMAQMRKMDCSNPLSWYYQGAIHNIPDYETYFKATGNKLCPQDSGKMWPGWATCPHMKPGLQQYHFLTWHRLYLYYLEKIVRKLSHKSDFALPYWNYNNVNERTLPEAFRSGDSASNSLFEIERSPFLMAGNSISPSDSDAIVMNVQILGKDTIVVVEPKVAMGAILDTNYLWTSSDIHHFSYELEDVVHNCIHDYVGAAVNPEDQAKLPNIYNRIYQQSAANVGGALMADVPSSAYDPIFFLHHANLDRLWMEWEQDHPSLALTFLEFEKAGFDVNYTFFDENGKEVKYTSLKQIYDTIRHVNYTYQGLRSKAKILADVKPVTINPNEALASLSPKAKLANGPNVFKLDLKNVHDKLSDDVFYTLELEVGFVKRPQTRIAALVFAKTPQKGEALNKYLAGWLSFFGASHETGAEHHGNELKTKMGPAKLFKLDITDELKGQNFSNARQIKVELAIEKVDPKNPITVNNIIIKQYQRK